MRISYWSSDVCSSETDMNDSLKTLLIVAFLLVILWNIGAGLYYMLVDKGKTKRTVNALTKRIALSVALILLVFLANYMGWLTPTWVGRTHYRGESLAPNGRELMARPRRALP